MLPQLEMKSELWKQFVFPVWALQSKEDHDQMISADHDRHAGHREEDQRVDLGSLRSAPPDVRGQQEKNEQREVSQVLAMQSDLWKLGLSPHANVERFQLHS